MKMLYRPLSQSLFLIAIFLKQFYILPSGSFQLCDMLFVLAFGVLLLENNLTVRIEKQDILFGCFIVCIFIINSVYYLIDLQTGFSEMHYLLTIAYYIYCFVIIIMFRQFINDLDFLQSMKKVLCFNIIFQLGIYLIGYGRWFDTTRYMGTFNDPNQFAFFLFSSLLLIYIISYIENKNAIIWLILVCFLVIKGASSGILLGLVVLVSSLLITYIFSKTILSPMLKIIMFLSSFILICFIIFSFMPISILSENMLIQRTFVKLQQLSNNSIMYLLKDRCRDKLIYFPEYLLYGSGEGNFMRFLKPGVDIYINEIHSSFLGPVFYYGLVPFMLMILWIKEQIKNIDSKLLCIFFAILAESLFLANNRQPFFWMIFVLLSSVYCKKLKKEVVS